LIVNLEKLATPLPSNSFSCEELALEFDDWYSALIPTHEKELSARQTACLSALHSYFDKISGEENAVLWTQNAMINRQEWDDIRLIARMAIDSLS
jgi:hypothetical protein